jgi:hypothetical protein
LGPCSELLTDERRISLEGVAGLLASSARRLHFPAAAAVSWSLAPPKRARSPRSCSTDAPRAEHEIWADKGAASAQDLDIHLSAHTLASKHKPVRAGN